MKKFQSSQTKFELHGIVWKEPRFTDGSQVYGQWIVLNSWAAPISVKLSEPAESRLLAFTALKADMTLIIILSSTSTLSDLQLTKVQKDLTVCYAIAVFGPTSFVLSTNTQT